MIKIKNTLMGVSKSFVVGFLFVVLGVSAAFAALTISNTNVTSDGALTITGTSAGVTIGNSSVTAVTVTTDGSGNGEIVLPSGAIDTTEILDSTIAGGDLASPNAYFVIQATKDDIISLLSDQEIFQFTAPAALTLVSVQVYVDGLTSTASIDVKEADTSVLSSAITPSADAVVTGTISDSSIASGSDVTIHATTNATGVLSDVTVTLIFKTAHTN